MVNVSPDSYGAMLEPDNVFHEKTWLAAGYLAGLGFGMICRETDLLQF